jgi:hypothetical protein
VDTRRGGEKTLVPEAGTEEVKFFRAWLPLLNTEHSERVLPVKLFELPIDVR